MSFDEADVLYNGFLHKLGAVNKAWKDRWFVLAGKKLYYFRSKENTKVPTGIVQVDNAYTRPGEDTNHPCSFEIITAQRIYLLAAPSQQVMQKWVNVLNAVSHVARDNEMFTMLETRIQSAEIEKNSRHVAEEPSEEDEEEEEEDHDDDDDDEEEEEEEEEEGLALDGGPCIEGDVYESTAGEASVSYLANTIPS